MACTTPAFWRQEDGEFEASLTLYSKTFSQKKQTTPPPPHILATHTQAFSCFLFLLLNPTRISLVSYLNRANPEQPQQRILTGPLLGSDFLSTSVPPDLPPPSLGNRFQTERAGSSQCKGCILYSQLGSVQCGLDLPLHPGCSHPWSDPRILLSLSQETFFFFFFSSPRGNLPCK
jgi:hypothetical protein